MKKAHSTSTLKLIGLFAAIAFPFAANAASVPTPKKTVAPKIEDASGLVRVLVDINQYGFVTDAAIEESSNAELNDATLAAIRQWTFNPAEEDGIAVSSKAVQPFSFNHGAIVYKEKKLAEDSLPSAKKRVAPTLSNELRSITGQVVLQAELNEEGRVIDVAVKSSTHEELESTASDALKKWTFKPAIESGKSIASSVIIPFHFKGIEAAAAVELASHNQNVDKAPKAIRKTIPELPSSVSDQRGEAKLKLTVDQHGFVAAADILESSNPALSAAAQEAALEWKFKPAIKNGEAVAATVIQPFSFNGGLITDEVPVDSMPSIKRSVQPELPAALAQVQGFVKVRLEIDAHGNVQSASCTKSSHDELVAPTVEAAKSWSFKPATRAGEKVPSSVVVPFVFNERS
ncbi:TonB family protein [Pelagicoccus albus]|uniref:TonB family protein n=1 Tax=Pelagicoccus albus TaxID=415222 RepID=A0A7X1B3Q4_9BACT|nr:TonB family protein [Pelagicoccus albus]MBC2605078.1 TonB family protein [Pelagicoccus albus]